MADYLIRVIAKEAGVRGLACLTTDLAAEAAQRHQTRPTATAVLAHGLTGGALFGALLKIRQRVAIKFEGNGPLRKLLVESDSYGKLRGYVGEPEVDLPLKNGQQDVVGALGHIGVLTVVKDVRLEELAEGVVPLAGQPLDDELTFYLSQSEQIPSFVEIGVYMNESGEMEASGGLLIQALPPYEDDIVVRLQERMQELPPLSALLYAGETPETVLAKVFAGIEYDVLEKRDLVFHCGCSRERSEKALLSLGSQELEHILANEGQAVVDCHFCLQQYVFSRDALEDLIVELEVAALEEE
ncbi:MAG: Hsp33 family molecular chaperone HslO [Anaerolineales bacterium]|nr:Hsp33 family molecular chaperone HslO [Anaerolineales bacterium]